MEKVSSYIKEDREFDFEDFEKYKESILNRDIKVWSEEYMDYGRLPGNIDIDEFLMFVGYRLDKWLDHLKYKGERPVYSPASGDVVLSQEGGQLLNNTHASPHNKIPWSISYKIKRKSPLSRKPPFGRDKHFKYTYCGYYKSSQDEQIYEVRMKEWESLVEFTILARSNYEVQLFTRFFEAFMDLNLGHFQKAGLAAMIPMGRTDEPEAKLDNSGIHYRKTQYWMHTQEFYVSGPYTTIKKIDLQTEVSDI